MPFSKRDTEKSCGAVTHNSQDFRTGPASRLSPLWGQFKEFLFFLLDMKIRALAILGFHRIDCGETEGSHLCLTEAWDNMV